ncbi:MarR family winged helix-turn-helix transcriptional regulator [Novosphingobium endophyticum]|uniref:MarR family winged helix-turn-helix transcriptional regulator n=1 Tax=Novosphingobium endophyticum TaxID=1955250 RepID=UPI001E5F94F4|nr:MarR family transcriptional regulator [Novosphingobium endophyticum]
MMPDDPLNELPGYALRRAANAMMAELTARLVPLDLRISDASVLMLIAERTDMTSSDIGKVLDIQRANMVPLLNRLEAAGLIARKPIDRKSQAVVLTPEGRERLADTRAIVTCFEDDLMARIPDEHRPHFLPALRALVGQPVDP